MKNCDKNCIGESNSKLGIKIIKEWGGLIYFGIYRWKIGVENDKFDGMSINVGKKEEGVR